jgi:hypothetical protein
MQFRTAALLAAPAIVPTCAEHLKIPNERPDISSTVEGDIFAGGVGGGGKGGVGGKVVIASRRLIRGQPSKKAQHLSEAMLVGTLKDGYIHNVPLPRVPRLQSASLATHEPSRCTMVGNTSAITYYSQVP